ncbi:MAG: hypothetical protein KGQ61_10810, partial [Planctomycetes bacterium]|nr:hypothetical protein [Planctomycetota bacterium]
MVTLPAIPVLPVADAALAAAWSALGTGLVWSVAEVLHARRTRRIAVLAFGPGGRPAAWAAA